MAFYVWNALLKVASWPGLLALRRFGRWIGTLIFRFNGSPARYTAINLQLICPEASKDQIVKLTRQSLEHTGQYLMECIYAWGAPRRVSQYCQKLEGLEAVRHTLAAGKGALLVVPHFGCTELACMTLSEHLPDTMAMYRTLKPASFYRSIRPQRSGLACKAVEANLVGIRQARQQLASGGVFMLAPDYVPKHTMATAPFMGIEVSTSTMPIRLARAAGADIFVLCGLRTPDGFEVHILPTDPEVLDPENENAPSHLNHRMQLLTELDLTQGHWFQKRFSSNPQIREQYKRARLD